MEKPSISRLLSDAAQLLRSEFEFIRKSNLHSAEKGSEVEDILRAFLNQHMPQRYRAGSGFIIDNTNEISRQTDVIIYDALSSPLYRASEKTQIVPADTVACVIEVKTALNKNDLEDAFKKIASCKSLKKTPLSEMDQRPTGSQFANVGTLGIVFGFDSDLSLDTLASHLKELNQSYPSNLWPDMAVVLDKGVIEYWVSFPGESRLAGELANSCDEGFPIPPFYVHLTSLHDGKYSLNRFFNRLLSQLTFYPRRPSTVPFDIILEGTAETLQTIEAYQYDTRRQLRTVPEERYLENHPKPPLSMNVYDDKGKQIGLMQCIPWQDGAIIRWYSPIPLQGVLPLLLSKPEGIVFRQPGSDAQLSSLLRITQSEFRSWPDLLAKKSNMKAELVEASST
jgi:hypothetical protein